MRTVPADNPVIPAVYTARRSPAASLMPGVDLVEPDIHTVWAVRTVYDEFIYRAHLAGPLESPLPLAAASP